jgi:hypothetical protein
MEDEGVLVGELSAAGSTLEQGSRCRGWAGPNKPTKNTSPEALGQHTNHG